MQAATSGLSRRSQNNNSIVSATTLLCSSPVTTATAPSLGGPLFPLSKTNKCPDSLWEFHNIDNLQFQQSNISAIPIASQENLLLYDLIYCLTGMRGSYITPELDAQHDGAGTYAMAVLKFKVSDQIHSSLRDIAQEILPLASHYTCIQQFIQKATFSNCSQVLQALSEALNNLIHDYYVSIS